MANFIKQRKLENKTTEDIFSFRQCITSQFKPKALKVVTNNKKESLKSSKQANVSRISLLILSRSSKKILEKSKFYKPKITSSSLLFSHPILLSLTVDTYTLKHPETILKIFLKSRKTSLIY